MRAKLECLLQEVQAAAEDGHHIVIEAGASRDLHALESGGFIRRVGFDNPNGFNPRGFEPTDAGEEVLERA